jgi:ferritin-like metal-binding protein YciE
METLVELLEDQIKDLYSAESQLIKALPKIAKAASSPQLKSAIEEHLDQTRTHVQRLEEVASELDMKPTGKTCAGMKGLIAEGSEAAKEDGADPLVDGAIIAAAQRVEHYEISGYGTARAIARQLGNQRVIDLLSQTLEEESATDEKLTQPRRIIDLSERADG